MRHPLSFAYISIFYQKYSLYQEKEKLHFNTQLVILLITIEVLKVALISVIAILMMAAKLTTAGILKIAVS